MKLFKGAVTSDGLPRNEMAACVEAGAHPNLIPVLGRLEAHPDATEGLVILAALLNDRFEHAAHAAEIC